MNESTINVVCGYAGDADRIDIMMPAHLAHQRPVIIMSPRDSAIHRNGMTCRQAGHRAYIGEDSLVRQKYYFDMALEYASEWFLFNDSDSFCVSAEIPRGLYAAGDDVLWSSEVTEPRPHASPYPKLAFQPPYFLHRNALKRMAKAGANVHAHEITPYVDWWMNAVCHEAGLRHRPFGELEHAPRNAPSPEGLGPWEGLDWRVRYCGATMMHPIKTQEQFQLCIDARKFYESQS